MASPPTSLPTGNISLYTLPLAWLLCLTPRLYAAFTFTRQTQKPLDLVNPRSLSSKAALLEPRSRDRILRAEAAMANGLENVGYFAAAVVAGNMAGLGRGFVNGLSVGYLASRVLYNLAYVFGETRFWGVVRSGLFFVGQGCVWALFVAAGREVNRGGR